MTTLSARIAAHSRSAFAVFALSLFAPAHAATLTVVHSFGGTDGYVPYGGVVQGTDGNFYGTTQYGGANSCGTQGCGTIFKLTPGGTLTTLHSFNNSDGRAPLAALVQATDGNFYGTAPFGGAHDAGTVYRITPAGAFTLLHSFAEVVSFENADGSTPTSPLVQGADGNLYGTTEVAALGGGTIFRITPAGQLTTLHKFVYEEGELPLGGVIFGKDGQLYGVNVYYGPNGGGTVFRFNPATSQYNILYAFSGGSDGGTPVGGLIQGADGNLYGTTRDGGATNQGTVFKLTPAGVLTTLHSFSGGSDGIGPNASLLQATDGALYGSTSFGGAGGGTLFRVTTSGQYTVLHRFEGGGSDGAYPGFGALIQGRTDGALYGATPYGGVFGQGIVFTLPGPSIPPAWISPPTPANSMLFNLTITRPFSIALRAADADALDTVHITASAKPAGSVLTPFDGNPANATFQWTPGFGQAGDYTVTFTAKDVGAPLSAAPPRTIRLHVQKRATSIVAKPAVLQVSSAEVHLHTIAVLSASDPSAPLGGKVVRFSTTKGDLICTATTSSNGTASCQGIQKLVPAVLSFGYVASFAGDGAYVGSSQYGYLIH